MKHWCSPDGEKPEVHKLENIQNFNLILDSYLLFNGEIQRAQPDDGTQIEFPRASPT